MRLFLYTALTALPSVLAYTYSTVSEHCSDLWSFSGDAGLEASTKVTNVTLIAASGTTPAFCSVTMYVEKYTGIVIYLPAEGKNWKGIFSSHGCGGSCGALGLEYVYGYGTKPYGFDLLERGYVTSMTDMGHKNSDYAVNTPKAKLKTSLTLIRTAVARTGRHSETTVLWNTTSHITQRIFWQLLERP
jgi:hypothetical protein